MIAFSKSGWAILNLSMLGLMLALSGCADAPVGSKKRPFTMYFVPSVDAQQITTSTEALTKFVSKEVSQKLYGTDEGFYVASGVPQSYIAVAEALGTRKADFAAFTTFAYILAKDIKKFDVEAVFTVVRGKDEMTYKGQIITRSDSKINSIEDLKGKKMAFTDPASTSGFILPSQLLKSKGIQLGDTVFGGKHDSVVTMVYQGQVDAGATYYSSPKEEVINGKKVQIIQDARARVKTQFPDVEQKVKILAFTQEIPNEPWVIRGTLFKDPEQNKKVKEAVIEAVLAFAKTPEGRELLKTVATGSDLIRVSDDTYAEIRKIVSEFNLNLEEVLTPKAKKG